MSNQKHEFDWVGVGELGDRHEAQMQRSRAGLAARAEAARPDIFVDLPNGAREFLSPEIDFISYDEADVYAINEIHPFVTEAVTFGIETPEQLDLYMDCRRSGHSPRLSSLMALVTEVDLGDLATREDREQAELWASCYTPERVSEILDMGRGCFIHVNRPGVYPTYGNPESGRPETMRAGLLSGFVYNVDGLPLYPVISKNTEVQARYRKMRLAGESHNCAEMFATRSFPGLKTDALFNEGRFSGESGRIDVEQRWLRERAEAAGVSTNGKYYMRGLADFPGDPTAWVSDRGDVLRVAREKNMTVHGYVEHEGHEVEPAADDRIADDLVENEVAEILAECPEANRDQVREEVFAVRTGGVDPHDLRVGDYDESYLQPEA